MSSNFDKLPYQPDKLPRELKKFYLSASDEELNEMLKELGEQSFSDLFNHIPDDIKFESTPQVTEHLGYSELIDHMEHLASKNNIKTSFIGDGLSSFKIPEIVPFVSQIRGLSTAYTPYQPERSQGTLTTLWMYSSAVSMLTGFEAINSSMYERSTCLFEALNTSTKITKGSDTAIVLESIYPGDMEVLQTLAQNHPLNIVTVSINPKTGVTDIEEVKKVISSIEGKVASIAFPQVNNLGNLEDVHALTDLAHELGVCAVAIIDPMLLATGGLTPPVSFGKDESGAHIIVGEGQHLALAPNFGGPGLGIFGIRYNESNKLSIRSTPGRFVGKGKDSEGSDALSIILATREQHIRKEKATSNICSNQAFIATLAGASILGRGEKGMTKACLTSRNNAVSAVLEITKCQGVDLAFAATPFYNQVTLKLPTSAKDVITKASSKGLHLGVDVSSRIAGSSDNYLLLSFFDIHNHDDIQKLINFFKDEFSTKSPSATILDVPPNYLRQQAVDLPNFSLEELKTFYLELGAQNVSPDDNIYPLGSCTMKYNPFVNDYVASLPGFTDIHPQAPLEDAQGSLEILYEIQEMFKKITGLPGIATCPVAGAQGELAGLKMFQAYHRNNGEGEKRNIILIPSSAHGTNPATATMCGFNTKKIAGVQHGIVLINAYENGQMDMEHLQSLVSEYSERIAGVMVTNPNTSGIFENKFKEMADLIHSVGGLVYMDGANMNAISSWINLDKMGVDAVHNNLHKTWSISHGGGGPGDAIVAVSDKLLDFIPGIIVNKVDNKFTLETPNKSMGALHRHFGNFAHKIRCYAYLKALGSEGIKKMSATAVLSARYLYQKLSSVYPTMPKGAGEQKRMHEFILTISKDTFDKIEKGGTPKAQAIAKIGKLFLDFGLHAPTVAFPEVLGLMIEPTESFNKAELDYFAEVVKTIHKLINEHAEVLTTVPHFTPVSKIDEVGANKKIVLHEKLKVLPEVRKNKISPAELSKMNIEDICTLIIESHAIWTPNE
ncbi:MAG: aminomethyl-transferring glycine dehydrogenase subunit GcvPB [Bacteriovoracaceae bacterium]|nr:aminomethyl-transferring glycine dehydrogenase subunit GcvPB [Bacteriovoracaceae bacterium]